MSKNQFVASQLILVFRPEIVFGMPKNQFVASQLILVFRPEIDFSHVQKSIRGLNIQQVARL